MAAVAPRFSRKWDYGIMLSLASGLLVCVAYIVTAEITEHDANGESHKSITAQINSNTGSLERIEANQLREAVMRMDALICEDPSNHTYRSELTRLIAEWESLTNHIFPRELLRCAR